MSLTVFSGKMKILNAWLNKIFGAAGHVHDGQNEDGSAPKVNLTGAAHVTGQLPAANVFETGTKMVFFQAAAPTGWTQDTTHNDKALRIVNGSGGGNGGTRGLSSATVGSHVLTESEMPAHVHGFSASVLTNTGTGTNRAGSIATGYIDATNSTGGDGAHDHDLALAYVDVIICTKD